MTVLTNTVISGIMTGVTVANGIFTRGTDIARITGDRWQFIPNITDSAGMKRFGWLLFIKGAGRLVSITGGDTGFPVDIRG